MRGFGRRVAWGLPILLWAPAVSAADGPGAAGFHFLNLGASARVEALAGAGTLLAGPGDELSFNPALLARSGARSASASGYTWLEDVQGSWLGATQPLGPRSSLGLGVRSLTVADFGNVPGETEIGQSDLAVVGGWGRGFGPVDAGVAFRWISSSLADESANGWSADAGLAWEWVEGWDLGAAVRNAGPAFGYGSGADDQLPSRTALAMGGTLGELRFDSEVLWENGPGWVGVLGAEWLFSERLSFRSGTKIGQDGDDAVEPWAAGLGVRVRGDLVFDYSFRDGLFDPSHRVGLRWSPDRSRGREGDDLARSHREFYADGVTTAIEQGLTTFPDDIGPRIIVRPAEAHVATEAVSEAISDHFRRVGFEVEVAVAVPAIPDSLDEQARAALAEAGIGEESEHPVLEYEVVASDYEVESRGRLRRIGPETIERRVDVDLGLRLLLPGQPDPVWTGTAVAGNTESVSRSQIPDSAGYPSAGAGGFGPSKMHPLVEPAIVGGIVTGLAVIFFSNRDVGE